MPTHEKENKAGGKISLFLTLFAIPIVAFIVAGGIKGKLDDTLRDALIKDYPEKASEISQISVHSVCGNYEFRVDMAEICDVSDKIGIMEFGAILAAVLAIVLLLGIKIVGRIARGSRTLLLLLFAPGLHLTMLSLSVLMVLHAALGMSAIYYGESFLVNRVHVGIIVALGLGAFFGVLAMIKAQFSAIKKATTIVLGKKLDPEQHPKIWRFVNELAKMMGAERPDVIVAGLDPNFYVTEANVVCLDGRFKGRTMYLSIPLCRIFSVDEIKAVLGHELAHYKGSDTRFSKRFYPIYRGATQGLINIGSGFSEKGGAGQLVLLPAFMVLVYFLNAFSDSEKKISREREIAADNEATKIENARHLATALVKLHAFSTAWLAIKNSMKHALQEGKALINASSLFAEIVGKMEKDETLENVSEEGPVHPTDTHPPLSQRLKNMNLTLESVIKDAAHTAPDKSAVDLFEKVEELERELTEVEHTMMIRRGEAQIGVSQAEAKNNDKAEMPE